MKTNILIYDEQIMFADALRCALYDEKNNKIYTFNLVDKLLLDLRKDFPQFVILSLHNINLNKIYDLLSKVLQVNKESIVTVIANIPQIKFIKKLFENGAKAYFDENSNLDELKRAIHLISKENVYICESTKEKMINYISCNTETDTLKTDELTTRELDVLKGICEGLNGKEISEKLFISINTVETHRRNIMFKLNVKNSLGLVKYAIQNELV